jgi:anti-sigma regulatory factor (Ser/Thr protein kinase)
VAHHRTTIPPTGESIGEARRVVEDFLRAHGLDALVDTAILLTSELVTVAVQEGDTDISIDIQLDPGVFRVAVADGRHGAVVMSEEADLARRLGLRLVNTLAEEWGSENQLDGKVVWFELRRPPLADVRA